jgi:hypothetical protein
MPNYPACYTWGRPSFFVVCQRFARLRRLPIGAQDAILPHQGELN